MGWLTQDEASRQWPQAPARDPETAWRHEGGADAGHGGWHQQPTKRPRRGGMRALVAALVVLAVIIAGLVLAGGGPATDAAAPQELPTPSAAATPSPEPSPEPSASPSDTPSDTPSASPPPAAVQAGSALAAMEALPVKGRAPKTGYDRDNWAVWSDFDGNGCDERQDTLARDLADVQRAGCQVVGGRLVDPYTGSVIVVPTADPQIDIDHVVSLSDAWQKGAGGWSGAQMQRFASDPLNLLAVSSSANRSKSDGDAATWLPANKGYRCEMVARQIAVKAEYGLWVTQAERDAMANVLAACPDQQLPQRGVAPAPVQPGQAQAVPSQPPAGVEVAPGLDPRFPSCKALKAAGFKGQYVQGVDPEYDWYRDGDGDGVVCE